MNQYPGFVPMVMPQHFMVAMPGMPLQGIQAGHPAMQQMMPGSMAVAHAGGMQVAAHAGGMQVATPAGLAQGMPMAAHQGTPLNMSALAALQERGQFLSVAAGQGFPGIGIPAMPVEEVVEPELEPTIDSLTTLDDFNCDLNLILDDDGYGAHPLNQPSGFCFTWAGSRATHGVCKGKSFYEVHITEHLPVDFGEDHNETDPHILRVGWSIDASPFQLGEEPWSYGYGGTGKFSANNKFSNYGEKFEVGDVIGAMVDLDDCPATISYMKNGKWLGVALPMHTYPVGNTDMALFPHILSKNCRFKVNFGQIDPWFPPPPMYQYVGRQPDKVRGMQEPERTSDCEMIMIVGLPGAGKTTWGMTMYKNHPDKRYNIIGTDTLIEKMRVMGLPRKRNYHGRWDVLINKASQCLNKLFTIAGKKKRNYILDQTNVYPSARKRKMKNFQGFYKIAAVLQPDDTELLRRSHKRTFEDGKFVPEEAVLEMKANFTLPEDRDNLFDRIDFIELPRDKCGALIDQYNNEGQQKRPPREAVFKHDNFRDSRNQPSFRGGDNQHSHLGHSPRQGHGQGQNRFPDQQQGYNRGQGQYPGNYPLNSEQEPPNKRSKSEAGSALDFLKQYGASEEDPVGGAGRPLVKEEPKWDRGQYAWAQQQFSGEPQGMLPKQELPPARAFPPHRDAKSQPSSAGTFQDPGVSTNWPPFEGGSDQRDRKPWQQNVDRDQPEGYGEPKNSARGFGENSRGFGGQNIPGSGCGSQQEGYGRKDGYGHAQENRNLGQQESWSQSRHDSRGSRESRESGNQDRRNISQESRSFDRPDSESYGQDSVKFGHQNSRNSDSKYGSQQGSFGSNQDFDGRQSGSFGRQQGSPNNFGNQRPGLLGAPPPPIKGQSAGFPDRSNNSPHNRCGSADSFGRDSNRNSFGQFGTPPPPPPPLSQEPEADRLGTRTTFQQDDSSSGRNSGSQNVDEKAVQRTERVRRRKSKWDTPSDPPSNPETPPAVDAPMPAAQVKVEPDGDDSSQYFDSNPKQQFSSVPSANDSDRHAPNNSWNDGPNEQNQFLNQTSDMERGQSDGNRGGGSSPSNQYGSDNQFGDEASSHGPPFNQGTGHHGNPTMRPPFEPRHPQQGGPRHPPPGGGPPGIRGPRPGFGPGPGGPRQFRPRNPSFGGPPTGQGGPPPGWAGQNRPRFGPRGPGPRPPFNPRFGPDGGQRFHRPPGPPRFPRQ